MDVKSFKKSTLFNLVETAESISGLPVARVHHRQREEWRAYFWKLSRLQRPVPSDRRQKNGQEGHRPACQLRRPQRVWSDSRELWFLQNGNLRYMQMKQTQSISRSKKYFSHEKWPPIEKINVKMTVSESAQASFDDGLSCDSFFQAQSFA